MSCYKRIRDVKMYGFQVNLRNDAAGIDDGFDVEPGSDIFQDRRTVIDVRPS